MLIGVIAQKVLEEMRKEQESVGKNPCMMEEVEILD